MQLFRICLISLVRNHDIYIFHVTILLCQYDFLSHGFSTERVIIYLKYQQFSTCKKINFVTEFALKCHNYSRKLYHLIRRTFNSSFDNKQQT